MTPEKWLEVEVTNQLMLTVLVADALSVSDEGVALAPVIVACAVILININVKTITPTLPRCSR